MSYVNYFQPFSQYIQKAFRTIGLKEIAGLNSGKLLGWSEMTYTRDPKAATRSSSETSFLQKALATTALHVYHVTLAKNITFDADKKAQSVTVSTAGSNPYTLSATKEVIIAAGAVCIHPEISSVHAANSGAVPIPTTSHGIGHWPQSRTGRSRD